MCAWLRWRRSPSVSCWAGLLCVPCWAGLLGVPVGGGPPASRPRRELGSARRLEARPGPATAHGHRSQALHPTDALHTSGACCAEYDSPRLEARPGLAAAHGHRSQAPPRSPSKLSGSSGALHTGGAGSLMCALRVDSLSGQAPLPPINFARNSPATYSNIEFASLELQCFWGVSKNEHDQLRAKFGRRWCRCCPWASQPGPPVPPVPSAAVGPGVLLWLAPSLPCMRYKVRPAREKRANLGHFERAGRVLSRTCGAKGCAGRVLYRSGPARFLLGEFCPAVAPSMCPVAGLPPPTGAAAGPSSVLHADAGGGFAALGAG